MGCYRQEFKRVELESQETTQRSCMFGAFWAGDFEAGSAALSLQSLIYL
jgi:hypothetical protein